MKLQEAPLLRKSLLTRLATLFAVVGLFCVALTSGSLYAYYRTTLNTEIRGYSVRFEGYLNNFTRRFQRNAELLASPQRTICGDRRVLTWLEDEKMQVIGAGSEAYWKNMGYLGEIKEAFEGKILVNLLWRRDGPPGIIAALPIEIENGTGTNVLVAMKYLDNAWLSSAAAELGVEIAIADHDGNVLSSSLTMPEAMQNIGLSRISNNSIVKIGGKPYGFHRYPLGEEGRYALFVPAENLRNLSFMLSGFLAAGFGAALLAIYLQYRSISGKTAGEIELLASWADGYLLKPESGKPPPMNYRELRLLSEAFENLVSRLDTALIEIEGKNEELSRQVSIATMELKERNILLDTIFTEMPQCVALLDSNGVVEHANTHAEEIFGAKPGTVAEVDLLTAISSATEAFPDKTLSKNGRDFIVHSRMLENRHRALVLALDVTERRIMEEHLFQTQKLESVSRLAGGVAHDFNNALASIVPSVDMLRLKITDEKALSYVDTIEKAALRGADVVRKLLAFSRAGSFNPKPLGINDVVEGALKVLKPSAKHANLVWTPGTGVPAVFGDEAQLQQLIFNIAINSLDATDGRCTITLKTWADPEKKTVNLSISDDGPGVPEEIAKHVFDPFFTTKKQSEAKTQGTGLGLAVAYGVVDRHDGRIRLVPTPGKPGATFEIELPAFDQGDAASPRGERPNRPASSDDIIIGKN